MNKKVNTALFVLGATVGNVIVMAILFFILLFLVSLVIPKNAAGGVVTIVFTVIFFAALVGSYFIYHAVMKFIAKKVDLEKYFHPIFKSRNKRT